MNTENTKNHLVHMGFKPENGKENIYARKLYYKNKYIDTVTVDFNKKSAGYIEWGERIKNVGRETSSVLTKKEFLAQLYWYINLVESGYKPEHIEIEHKVSLGRKNGFIDILINKPDEKDDKDTPFMILDVKTQGKEFDKSKEQLRQSEGQIASYSALSNNVQYVGAVTAGVDNDEGYISSDQFIVSTAQWFEYGSVEEYKEKAKNQKPLNNAFRISRNVEPYNNKQVYLTPKELIDLEEYSSSKLFHDFLTILRKHGISDKTNAFNKVLNLFTAKIVDEFNTPDNRLLSFQVWPQDQNLEDLYARIESLYSQGLRDFIQIHIDTDKDFTAIDQILDSLNITDDARTKLENRIEHMQSKSNADFQFKDVYDDQTYHDNLVILKELVELIAPYKLKYAKKQQFLGDFFENILANGFKQESGQFFTPVPLARFMVESMPLEEMTKHIMSDSTNRSLLPKMIDFSCGSGHFLTEYMDKMQRIINSIDYHSLSRGKQNTFKNYQNDPFEWSQDYVYGLDIDYRLVKTAKVSSFLNGDGDAIIQRANGLDSFTSSSYTKDLHLDEYSMTNPVFDVLIANPPYHVDEFKSELPHIEEDFNLGKSVTLKSSEIEALFVERAAQLLKPNGLMAIVLPSSILNTENSLYVQARQILLKKFKIVAIMRNPNKATFLATHVETVTIFAKRRTNEEFNRLKNEISNALHKRPLKDIALNGRENYLDYYIKDIFGKDFDLNSYEQLLDCNYTGENQEANDCLRLFTTGSNSDSDKIINDESERIAIYALSDYECAVIQIPTSGNMKESLELLGYKFSNRRGDEGIHPRIKGYTIDQLTLLYGDDDNYLNKVVQAAFDGDFSNLNIINEAKPFFRIKQFNDLIDYSVKSHVYKIMIARALSGKVLDYGDNDTINLDEVAYLENGTTINSRQISEGTVPVIAGGREPAYYHSDANRLKPTITISQSGAYAGYVAYHDEPIFASDCFTITAKPDSGYTTLELYYLLKNKQKEIYAFATGSVQRHVYSKNMERFRIPRDPMALTEIVEETKSKAEEQKALASNIKTIREHLIESSDKVFRNNESKLHSLDELKSEMILNVKGGKRIPKELDYAPFKTKHLYPNISDFEYNSINLENVKYIDNRTFDKIQNYVLKPNDVFISAAGTIGKVGMMPNVKDKTISLTENAHKITNINEEKLDSHYLMYILNTTEVQDQIRELISKTGTPKLSIASLKKVKIPLLPIEEQKELAKTWDSWNHKIKELASHLE